MRSCSGGAIVPLLDAPDRLDQLAPRLAEDAPEDVLLRVEVVVEEPVRDAGLLRDVADPRGVVALPREDPHRRVQEQPALVPLLERSGTAV